MRNRSKYILFSLFFFCYTVLFIAKPIYQYYSFSNMEVKSSMIELIQDKYEKYWNDIDRHIHIEKSKENGQNIGIIYVIDNDNQIESNTGSSVTVWEQRSDNAMNQLYTVVNQMRKRVLNHLLQKILCYSIALVCFLLGWKIYYHLRRD